LTVLSLLAMAWRAHKRGRFGRKAGATLRSLYPIVLGLGGWFLGLMIVITTMPGTPLDNELLAAFSVGVAVGLSLYFAWLNRGWAAQTKAVGLAAGIGGALVGARAWLHGTARLPRLVN